MHVEAYVSCNIAVRALSLFMLPRKITVEPGGMRAVVPRSLGRTEVNGLLQAFGQTPVG